MATLRDLTGQRFGRLVVLRREGTYIYKYNTYWRQPLWLCRCDCGEEVVINGANLKSGGTKSCGCLRREVASKNGKKRKGAHFTQKRRKQYE